MNTSTAPIRTSGADHEYLFDVKHFASLCLKAPSESAARRILTELLDCASVNCGALPDGSPLVGEASPDGEFELIEVDGTFLPGC